MNFQLGNKNTQQRIFADFSAGNIPHAFLLSGPKDMGKFDFITELASFLLGENAIAPELVLVDKLYMYGVSDDLEELSQFSTFNQIHRKKKRTKSNSLGVDDIASFTKHLHETVTGKYKIVCIRDIERMTIASSNKFLKILEEPPHKTIFLLTTSSPQKLLPTITSRCRTEYFSLLSPQEMLVEISQSSEFFTENEKKLLLQISAGKSKELLTMMNDSDYMAAKKEKFLLVQKIIESTPLERMQKAEDFSKKSLQEIYILLENFLLYLRGGLSESLENVKKLELVDETLLGLQQNGNKRMFLERLFLLF